jgi:hypothetical protein
MVKRKAAAAEPEPEKAPRKGRVRASVPRGGVMNALRETQPDTRTQITMRLGKRWSQIITEVKAGQYTWDEFAEELDPEELARAQLKDRDGTFKGRPPSLVPRQFQLACVREIQRRFNEKVQTRLLDAVDELIDLSKIGRMDGKDRAKILVYLIERVMGPVPKTVHVTADEPWQGLLTQGLLRPREEGVPASPPPRSDRYAKRRRRLDPEEDKDD